MNTNTFQYFPTYREKLCGSSVTFNEFRGLRRSSIVHAKQRTLSRLAGLQTRERKKLYLRSWGLAKGKPQIIGNNKKRILWKDEVTRHDASERKRVQGTFHKLFEYK